MIIPFIPEHALELRQKLQEGQKGTAVDLAHGETMARGHCAWTCVNADFDAVAAAGILPMWPGRGLAWALISEDAGPHMREVTKATIAALDCCPCRRVELYVRLGFHQAFRWAKILGFEFEAVLEEADPHGGDMAIFKRVRHGLRAHSNGSLLSGGKHLQRHAGKPEFPQP